MFRIAVKEGSVFKLCLESNNVEQDTMNPKTYNILEHLARPLYVSVEGEDENNILPIYVCCTIRTDYTNEAIISKEDKFYTEFSLHTEDRKPLGDYILLSAQKTFEESVNILKVDILKTSFKILGASVIEDKIFVYCNIIMDCNLKQSPNFSLKEGYQFTTFHNLRINNVKESMFLESLKRVQRKEQLNEWN